MAVITFTLDQSGNPQPEPDTEKWLEWFMFADKKVALDELPNGYRVSTAFLGVDHNILGTGAPLLWETLIVDEREHKVMQERYTSYEQAVAGHRINLNLAKAWAKQ
jgi:hypothetical protein